LDPIFIWGEDIPQNLNMYFEIALTCVRFWLSSVFSELGV